MRKVLIFLIFGILSIGLLAIPALLEFGSPKMSDMDNYFLANGQAQTATNNICTSIVFDYRGFDTLGESTVLFSAVVGVGLMFRHLFRGEEHEDE
jgi:multisubunit Na+/H+ antiporter MnhB subunit